MRSEFTSLWAIFSRAKWGIKTRQPILHVGKSFAAIRSSSKQNMIANRIKVEGHYVIVCSELSRIELKCGWSLLHLDLLESQCVSSE